MTTLCQQVKRPRPLLNQAEPTLPGSATWAPAGDGYQLLHGSVRGLGYSVEWHDFTAHSEVDWAQSLHPESLEICLNQAGHGRVEGRNQVLTLSPLTSGFYVQSRAQLQAFRRGGERHQFITIELSLAFLKRQLPGSEAGLHRCLECLTQNKRSRTAVVSAAAPLRSEHHQVLMDLRHPPVPVAARNLWYQAKVLELAASLLYSRCAEEGVGMRQQHLAQERVNKVIQLLKANLAEPPDLQELGRKAGCSPCYLSRTFSAQTGMTIPRFLRKLRMERAAELLQSGKYNVTEAALEVGYSSLSHFSCAFHESFGCCPGLYPLTTRSQRLAAA